MCDFRRIFGVFVALAVMMVAGASVQAAQVTGVRIGDYADKTRFVIDLSENVESRIFMLSDPYRVVIDTPELVWDIDTSKQGTARGLISKYRFGLFQPGTSRIVLDMTGPVRIQKQFMLRPQGPYQWRFVLDLEKTDAQTFLAEKGTPPPPPDPELPDIATKNDREDGKRVIVIDAGHGGVDPGAIGVRGTHEKDVTLAAAKEVGALLEKTGRYHVVYTRKTDIFIPLRGRVDIGRKAKGDLFISLHADSIGNRKVRGGTVYTLSETSSDKEAAALARKENKADVIAGLDFVGESEEVTSILIDLAQRETMNYSATFANMLVDRMAKRLEMRTNSHRFAGFRVLKAPDVPSVLVEMGYLSSPEDEKMLRSREGMRRVASSVVEAVDAYFDQQARLANTP